MNKFLNPKFFLFLGIFFILFSFVVHYWFNWTLDELADVSTILGVSLGFSFAFYQYNFQKNRERKEKLLELIYP